MPSYTLWAAHTVRYWHEVEFEASCDAEAVLATQRILDRCPDAGEPLLPLPELPAGAQMLGTDRAILQTPSGGSKEVR